MIFQTTSSTTIASTTTAPPLDKCTDPSKLFPEGSVVHSCTSSDFVPDSSCKFHCDEDYHSTNPNKLKTQIECKCDATGCNWKKIVEMSCQGPCRHQNLLFTKTSYYFKVLKDFNTTPINVAAESVLVLVSAKARTNTKDWTLAFGYKMNFCNNYCSLYIKVVKTDQMWSKLVLICQSGSKLTRNIFFLF